MEESPFLKFVRPIFADIADRDSISPHMGDLDIVFHLAAQISVPYSYEAPESFIAANVTGTLNVLRAARMGSCPRIIHTSTSEVYGSAQTVPIDETHPRVAQSPYAASKIAADAMCEAAGRCWPPSLEILTLRPFNTFGPRQSTRAILPVIISQALVGNVIKLGAVSPRRDLNYVQDNIEAYLLAGLAEGLFGIDINIGTGVDISVGELVTLVGKVMGKSLDVQCDEQRLRPQASEVTRLIADNSRAQSLLGWKPMVSLERGIERTVEWMRQQGGPSATAYAV